jgi:hypothetical protein
MMPADPLIGDLRAAVQQIVSRILKEPTWPLRLSPTDRAFVQTIFQLVVLIDGRDDVVH